MLSRSAGRGERRQAVLVANGITFPRTHNLSVLLDLVPKSIMVPLAVEDATDLTQYAVATRYPGVEEPVTAEEYATAIRAAEAVVKWAADLVGTNPPSPASNPDSTPSPNPP